MASTCMPTMFDTFLQRRVSCNWKSFVLDRRLSLGIIQVLYSERKRLRGMVTYDAKKTESNNNYNNNDSRGIKEGEFFSHRLPL